MIDADMPMLPDYDGMPGTTESKRRKNIIAFGKYKGQPAEILLTDPSYCEWLQGQNWFIERYPQIHTLIINNFTQSEDTPAHNALQARFLDESLCASLCDRVLSIQDPDYKKTAREAYQFRLRQCTERKENKKDFLCLYWEEPNDACFCRIAAKSEGHINIKNIEFEENGWDVRIHAALPYGNPEQMKDLEINISVEIKPTIGDDYPSVLRQIKSNISGSKSYYALVYNDFTASGVTLDQVRRIFKQSGIDMISYDELDTKEAKIIF